MFQLSDLELIENGLSLDEFVKYNGFNSEESKQFVIWGTNLKYFRIENRKFVNVTKSFANDTRPNKISNIACYILIMNTRNSINDIQIDAHFGIGSAEEFLDFFKKNEVKLQHWHLSVFRFDGAIIFKKLDTKNVKFRSLIKITHYITSRTVVRENVRKGDKTGYDVSNVNDKILEYAKKHDTFTSRELANHLGFTLTHINATLRGMYTKKILYRTYSSKGYLYSTDASNLTSILGKSAISNPTVHTVMKYLVSVDPENKTGVPEQFSKISQLRLGLSRLVKISEKFEIFKLDTLVECMEEFFNNRPDTLMVVLSHCLKPISVYRLATETGLSYSHVDQILPPLVSYRMLQKSVSWPEQKYAEYVITDIGKQFLDGIDYKFPWTDFKDGVLQNTMSEKLVDTVQNDRVLEKVEPPTVGTHPDVILQVIALLKNANEDFTISFTSEGCQINLKRSN